MKTIRIVTFLLALVAGGAACDEKPDIVIPDDVPVLSLKEMAEMISALPIESEHVREVMDAVTSSTANGYDEEYMMTDLMSSPGSGVGPSAGTKGKGYAKPMKELIRDYLSKRPCTRSGGMTLDEYLHRIEASDMQIYWPYHELWDGEALPVVTFDPGGEAISNIGYEIVLLDDGSREVREVIVTESMARERPVWVINSNDDSAYQTGELLERLYQNAGNPSTKSGENIRTLVLKEFKMKRHYDNWFRGASEFFVKCGAVSGFTASTEAELRIYQPSITDFMIVVRRSELLVSKTFNVILISDWTDQLEDFAFMITEDDGGTRTSWKTEAVVKVQSKSYGINLELPYNSRDDIVWRGSLSSRYFESYRGEPGHFGDVDVVFEIQER